MEELEQQIQSVTGITFLTELIMAVIILAVTGIAAHAATKFLRHLLAIGEEKSLPSSTIFVNIARGAVWIIGLCIMLSSCFGVDVSAAVTALGIGGIAVSLGFKDTISNLIGGLQVSLARIIAPGDHISVGSSKGVVEDVTWRHTTISNAKGETMVIPNSTINTTALVRLPPVNKVTLSVVVANDGTDLDARAAEIEQAAARAAASVGLVEKAPALSFSEVLEDGFKGSVIFWMKNGEDAAKATDAVVRAIAPFTRA